MAPRRKRDLLDFDPNKSDPEDLDYGASSPPAKRSRTSKTPATKSKSAVKKKTKRNSGYSDDDDEDDDIAEESFDDSESEEEVVRNERTGRPVRSANKNKDIKYEEPSEDDIEDTEEAPPATGRARTRTPARSQAPKGKLVVKFNIPPADLTRITSTRPRSTRASSRTHGRDPTPDMFGARRSSRLSQRPSEEPMVELSGSGRNERAVRSGSQGATHHPNIGRKGPLKRPSIIMEASQETARPSIEEDEVAEHTEAEPDKPVESNVGNRPGSEIRYEQEEDEQPDGGAQATVAVIQESFHNDEDEVEEEEDSDNDEGPVTRGRNLRSKPSESEDELDQDELADEAADLAKEQNKRRRTRRAQNDNITYDDRRSLRKRNETKDYKIVGNDVWAQIDVEEDAAPATTPSRNRRGGGGGYRSLFSTEGPFGGAGGPPALLGNPAAAGGADSDSSDDEFSHINATTRPIGGLAGMTPTSASVASGPGLFPQAHNADPVQAGAGGALGKLKDKKALADADPLGVDMNVNFEGVGGLEGHIDQLKEMVTIPLLYPELFSRFNTTPPRGVLFHGPPGTGKTLLARALASSVSSQGKKVTFYMRKGADALSKWVGEAERQLRLLFEEARKNQPSIIFFDEIDGLAPVRSSKQEQIHASIVATLLALMDGMDGRGQVVVIGATNRPDSVDPALRRPGRFDREFYFPLPDIKGRRSIIDIHTKGWDPPLAPSFKDQLADLTKGYGGADLRALCTEAALNAVQGTYPQIYQSDKKLVIDPSKIKVLAKDFMIAVNKMVPSSERSAASGAAPLSKAVEPLLRFPLSAVSKIIDDILPQKKKVTALEEAQYDDRNDDFGFERETMQRDFERNRVFRPRLLIRGVQGMGQQYLGSALLHRLERLHVQFFDLPTLLEDASRSPEAAIVQLFKEVRRQKPGVIYIPNVDVWYQTVSKEVLKVFTSMLRAMPPNDPILLLGIMEQDREESEPDKDMIRDLFGFSLKNQYKIARPDKEARSEYFNGVMSYIKTEPTGFPDPNRQKRKFADLQVVEDEPAEAKVPTKEEIKAQRLMDRHNLNMLKVHLQPIMEQIKTKYKRFRTPVIEDNQIRYLFDETDPAMVATDIPHGQRQEQGLERPYELGKDSKGIDGIIQVATGKFYYNLTITVIEQRLQNGYYKRPKDFVADLKRLLKDATTSGDYERIIKSKEMLANVEVDVVLFEAREPLLMQALESVYVREGARARKMETEAAQKGITEIQPNMPPATQSGDTMDTSGPIVLGDAIPGMPNFPPVTPKRLIGPSLLSNGDSTGRDTISQQAGSTMPPNGGEDSQEADEHADKRLRLDDGASSAPGTQARSQRSGHQAMAPHTQVSDYQNSASTTTSGQKTSERSHRSSGPWANTQSTGIPVEHRPDFSVAGLPGGSQLPDTQEPPHYSSQPSGSQPSQSSQAREMPPPPTALSNILNTSDGTDQTAPTYICDEVQVDSLHRELTTRTSGLSVEQLEQVNATLMGAVWESRMNWNRNQVLHNVQASFNEVMKDIEAMQRLMGPSQTQEAHYA
ncbi:AAA-domain-containing protein [Saccharata proteae CBS 121410]|uniref:AAA-domain-containing protein n=1 Tax=Saccharata proteae CBS 121410 TaxID=1314787 RepID=A0A9P4HTJ7_9PEZI|nr:AAA-domain-containing protein [Saccharata proteae CBS 121410]